MPRTPVQHRRVTNADLAAQITGLRKDVVPRLERIEGLAKKAGLNGFSEDIHEFFEQRAESVAARQWITRKLRPLIKLRYVVTLAGLISTVAWAILAVRQLIILIPPHIAR